MKFADVLQFVRTPKIDERGEFNRHFSKDDMVELNCRYCVAQANLVQTTRALTSRGMPLQVGEYAETKLLSCLAGEILSFLTDLRPASLTFLQSTQVHLTTRPNRLLLIPEGVADGSMTLTDDVLVHHHLSCVYYVLNERGFRFDDPLAAIQLPSNPLIVSQ